MPKRTRKKRNQNPLAHQHEGAEWEPVWQGNSEPEAEIVAGGLIADGIRARSLGSQRLPGAMPHAFLADTWAVFVPSSHADDARAILRGRGSSADVVEGSANFSSDQRATLAFVFWGMIAITIVSLLGALLALQPN